MFGNYFSKLEKLQKKGIRKKLIIPYEEELYKKLDNIYMSNIPLSFHIKYLRPKSGVGKCYERTVYLSFAFDDFVIQYGLPKDLILTEGKERAGHYWLEVKDKNNHWWVYDSSHMAKIDKKFYYKMYAPKKIITITKEEFIQTKTYDMILNSKINKVELLNTIPLLEGIARNEGNIEFIKSLEEFKKKIFYNAEELNKMVDLKLNTKIKSLCI